MHEYRVTYYVDLGFRKQEEKVLYIEANTVLDAFTLSCESIEKEHFQFYINCICEEQPLEYLFD